MSIPHWEIMNTVETRLSAYKVEVDAFIRDNNLEDARAMQGKIQVLMSDFMGIMKYYTTAMSVVSKIHKLRDRTNEFCSSASGSTSCQA